MEYNDYQPIQEMINKMRDLFKQAIAECNNKVMDYESCRLLEELNTQCMLNVIGITMKQNDPQR